MSSMTKSASLRPLAGPSTGGISPQSSHSQREFPVGRPAPLGAFSLAKSDLVSVSVSQALSSSGSLGAVGAADLELYFTWPFLPNGILVRDPPVGARSRGDSQMVRISTASCLPRCLLSDPECRSLAGFLGVGHGPSSTILEQGGLRQCLGTTIRIVESNESRRGVPRKPMIAGHAHVADLDFG